MEKQVHVYYVFCLYHMPTQKTLMKVLIKKFQCLKNINLTWSMYVVMLKAKVYTLVTKL